MNDKKFILGIVAATLAILAGTVFLAGKMASSPKIEKEAGSKVKVEKTAFDWGKINMDNGDVQASFKIENVGNQTLKLFSVKTSCMCTTAQLTSGETKSPLFGMHSNSPYVLEVRPGEAAELKVMFDPAYHGPSGIGPITRQVEVATNDPDNSSLSFILTATVVR